MGFSTIEFVVGTIFGALIQMVLQVMFEERFRKINRRLSQRWTWLKTRFHEDQHVSRVELFHIGAWKVNWMVIEGTSIQPYERNNIICHLEDGLLELPPDLQSIRIRIEERENKIRQSKGSPQYYNGPMVALADILISRVGLLESKLLVLRFKQTDYYAFLATAMNLDEVVVGDNGVSRTIRDKYLKGIDYRYPVSEIATSFGVNMAVITKDGYLVLVTRAQGLGPYPGYYSDPICESVQPNMDNDAGGLINLYQTAKRGADEELGIEVMNDEVFLFSIGVDTNWYQYSMSGMILSKSVTKDALISRRGIGIKDKWEASDLVFVHFDPNSIARFLSDTSLNRRFHPGSFVSIIQSLIHEFGQSTVEEAFNKYSP